jgi:hypothetical protein
MNQKKGEKLLFAESFKETIVVGWKIGLEKLST